MSLFNEDTRCNTRVSPQIIVSQISTIEANSSKELLGLFVNEITPSSCNSSTNSFCLFASFGPAKIIFYIHSNF